MIKYSLYIYSDHIFFWPQLSSKLIVKTVLVDNIVLFFISAHTNSGSGLNQIVLNHILLHGFTIHISYCIIVTEVPHLVRIII